MDFEKGIILLLLGAILGSGGAILTGKSVLRRRGISDEDIREMLERWRRPKLSGREDNEGEI